MNVLRHLKLCRYHYWWTFHPTWNSLNLTSSGRFITPETMTISLMEDVSPHLELFFSIPLLADALSWEYYLTSSQHSYTDMKRGRFSLNKLFIECEILELDIVCRNTSIIADSRFMSKIDSFWGIFVSVDCCINEELTFWQIIYLFIPRHESVTA